MQTKRHIIVVGSGIFGICAAVELSTRGHHVTVMDSDAIPARRAASTDISKVIRMDYGADEFYASMMIEAFDHWERWNFRWGEEVYHQVGFLMLTKEKMSAGGLEFDSLRVQQRLGYQPELLSPDKVAARYPAWNAAEYQDGYFNPKAGWAESGRIVSLLREDAQAAGVRICEHTAVQELLQASGRVTGVRTKAGDTHSADCVVVAAGTWSPLLCNSLTSVLRHTAQPVFHFRPRLPELFQASRFPVWSADIGKTGFYGFPLNRDGVVKVANHGPGRAEHPDAEHATTIMDEQLFRDFLKQSLPSLADAPIAASKTCFYADSWDGDFYIDRDPNLAGVVYATGGSGHGFKFAPLLGELIADIVDERPNRYAHRFAWRQPDGRARREQARYQGDGSIASSGAETRVP